MTAFAERVAEITGVAEARLERLAGGDLSEVLLVRRDDGPLAVAKGGLSAGTEAAMLRRLMESGVSAPAVEGEHDGLLLLEHVPNDGVLSPKAWADIGTCLARLHGNRGDRYGWSVDYSLGSVHLDNKERDDWASFWAEQRLSAAAAVLDRPWRERVAGLCERIEQFLPPSPPPALLHGDLWSGNILVRDGTLAAFIDPACYHGHCEVDLAMLTLFDTPSDSFFSAYGSLEPGWRERQPVYQLFPALVHLRLFGDTYSGLVGRLLDEVGA
jgi:fructosamine-3-kinase